VPTNSAAAATVTPLASGMQIVNYIPFAGAATTVTTTAIVKANALDTGKISTASAAAAIEHSSQLGHHAVVTAEVVDSGYVSDVSDDDVYEAQFDRYDSVFASSVYNMSASDKQHSDNIRLSVSTGSLSSLDSSVHSSSSNSSSSGTTAPLSSASVSPQCKPFCDCHY
jgi:hypothetical protein